MNKPFTPPESVAARRDWRLSAWDRPVRGSFLIELDDGRTGLVVGDDLRALLRRLGNALALAGLGLVVWAAVIGIGRLAWKALS